MSALSQSFRLRAGLAAILIGLGQPALGAPGVPPAPAAAGFGPTRAPPPPAGAAPAADFALLVEPMSAEWEARLVPPLLQNLLRIAPYATARAEAPEALRAVAGSTRRLALLRRSSAVAVGAAAGLELLEIGPAACLVLAVREDAPWRTYADLNYGLDRPPRLEATSPGALADVRTLLSNFPLAGEASLQVRPTHIAIQRLNAGDSDLVALDVSRRGAADQPAEVMDFLLSRHLRPLDLPPGFETADLGGRLVGEVVVSKGWFWESPRLYRSLCDPFVLAMPTAGADHLIYALYSGVTGTNGAAPAGPAPAGRPAAASENNARLPAAEESGLRAFWSRLSDAFQRLLVALGILSPPPA